MPLSKGVYPQKGEAKILRRGFKRYGVYCDEGGEIHSIPVKCPHMGCELAWNDEDKTWYCLCHGSRFDCDGKLIDNPDNADIS